MRREESKIKDTIPWSLEIAPETRGAFNLLALARKVQHPSFDLETKMTTWEEVLKWAKDENVPPSHRVEKTEDEWRAQLSPECFEVTRRAGTERAFSSKMCSAFEPGIYSCACCGTDLFDSTTKFDSGTGWPSFSEPMAENVVSYHSDASYGMIRVETTCSVCDAHLGHVFPDGPQKGALRYCINALSLDKKATQ